MRVKTINGSDTDLGQDKLDGLKARLRGPLLKSGDAGYEDCRTVWNGMIDRRPALVARCVGADDVAANIAK